MDQAAIELRDAIATDVLSGNRQNCSYEMVAVYTLDECDLILKVDHASSSCFSLENDGDALLLGYINISPKPDKVIWGGNDPPPADSYESSYCWNSSGAGIPSIITVTGGVYPGFAGALCGPPFGDMGSIAKAIFWTTWGFPEDSCNQCTTSGTAAIDVAACTNGSHPNALTMRMFWLPSHLSTSC